MQGEIRPQEPRGPQGMLREIGPEARLCNAEVMKDILCELVGQDIEVVVEDNIIKNSKA